jgi:hypothetical protein
VTAFLLGIFMLGEHTTPLKFGGTALIFGRDYSFAAFRVKEGFLFAQQRIG